jgi:PKD repeat protein
LKTEKHLKTNKTYEPSYDLGEAEKKMNKKQYFCMLVLTTLLLSNAIAVINAADHISTPVTPIKNTSSDGDRALVVILKENFSAGVMPPAHWTLQQTNVNETWEIDTSLPYSKPNCAGIHRGTDPNTQDEWLITPRLDFTNYTKVNMTFYWYTSCYVAHWVDYIDLNVWITLDNGSTWTFLWSDDNITQNYTSWTWINTNMNKDIPLSKYIGNNNVKLAFQYYSTITDLANYQELSIDDIIVMGEGVGKLLECSAGGPYDWCWDNQHNYIPYGVRFHGNVTNSSWWKCTWLWDFGDNSTSTLPLNPIHNYANIGTYNLTLRVIDNTTFPNRIAYDHTIVRIFIMPAPELEIKNKPALWGIQSTLMNDGQYLATNINWTMVVHWGLLQGQEKKVGNGTIPKLDPQMTSEPMTSGYFFALGFIHIEISAIPENIPGINKEFNAFKIGPFVLILSK